MRKQNGWMRNSTSKVFCNNIFLHDRLQSVISLEMCVSVCVRGREKDERRKEAWKREKHINLVWNYRKISCRQRMPCGESRSYRSFYSQNQQIHARTLILALHLYVCMPPHSSWKSSLKCGYFTEKAFAFCITMLLSRSLFRIKNPISRWENLSMKMVCSSMCVCYLCSQFGIISIENRFWSRMNR